MSFAQQYRQSLKSAETEEFIDLVFYRPLAVLFVKLLYRFPVTPNQISFISMVVGVLAAWQFSEVTGMHLTFASVLLAFSVVLDCADGQIARLKKNGTSLGRVVDGIADYVVGVAVFVGVGIGLSRSVNEQWIIVILAGVSTAIHAIIFDHHQRTFIMIVKGEANALAEEISMLIARLGLKKNERRITMHVFLIRLYVLYLQLQHTSLTRSTMLQSDPEIYRRENSFATRLWSFLGPSTNRTVLIVCAFCGHIEWYLWTILVGGNLWLSSCFFLQSRINKQQMVQ
jgi:phosphatidylglycerophosphate synthase